MDIVIRDMDRDSMDNKHGWIIRKPAIQHKSRETEQSTKNR